MTFLTDGTAVKFTGIDHTFNVYSTFVEFNIGSSTFSIKFYGLIIAFGFLLAVLFGGRMAYKWKMDLNKMLDVLLYGTIGGIIGAKLLTKIPNKYLKIIFALFLVYAGINMIIK